ncbi:MAG TPA: site-2 protease family protein [Gemmataceae bacterium]|nr:site-2 protease family protein [Gemmataceae bacterium]
MFGAKWRLLRLAGIPISVDLSWLIILALLTFSFASGFPFILHEYFPAMDQELAAYQYWLMGLATAIAFFVCILLHELGHAIVAKSRGMPIRGITLFLFGGVAELGGEPPSAATEFLMAIAGPAVSVVLGLAFGILAVLGVRLAWPAPIIAMLGYLAAINAMVLIFNLIPAFPLDGGRVLRSILWGISGNLRSATYWASLAGQGFAWLLIILGGLQIFQGQWLGGIWMGLIGLFLNSAAQGGYQQVIVRQALEGEPVRRFVNEHPISVPPTIDLQHWVEDFVYRYHHRSFPVVTDGHLEGIITTQVLSQVPRHEWSQHTVGETMSHDLDAMTIPVSADAMAALGKMQRTGSSRLFVVDGDTLVGLITLKDMLHLLNIKLELEDGSHDRPRYHPPVEEIAEHEHLAHH